MITNAEIRQARAFIYSRGFTTKEIQPKLFAMTAQRMGKSFSQLLSIIAILKLRGQGLGPAPKAEQFLSAQ